jgi:hypothetical protein
MRCQYEPEASVYIAVTYTVIFLDILAQNKLITNLLLGYAGTITRCGKTHFSTGFCRFFFILTISMYELETVAVSKDLMHQKET